MKVRNLINIMVVHCTFGDGIVTNTNGNIFEVKFEGSGKTSKFSYPVAFQRFLKVKDSDLEAVIKKDLDEWLISSGTLESEQLRKKTAETQAAIREREMKRQKARQEKARAEAQRSRFFAGLDNPNVNLDDGDDTI